MEIKISLMLRNGYYRWFIKWNVSVVGWVVPAVQLWDVAVSIVLVSETRSLSGQLIFSSPHPLTLGQCSWGSLLRLAQCPPLVFQAPSSSLLTVNTGHFIAQHFSKIHSDEKWEKSSSQKWSYQSVLAAIYKTLSATITYMSHNNLVGVAQQRYKT